MGINSQSQALMDKIRAKKGIPLFLNTVARVREANIRQYCTDPPLVEIGKTQDGISCQPLLHPARSQSQRHEPWNHRNSV